MTAPTRTPVVLLHALSLHASMWDHHTQALRARGHQVIPFDQRGFGTAPLGTAQPSLDVVADDLAQLLDDRGIDRAVLAGSSMGGYAAMAFLARHPGRTAALALLSARATADTPEARAQRLQFAALVEDAPARATIIDRTTPLLVGATTRARHPEIVARLLADARAADPKALAWAQRAIAARPDATATLRATDVPAVVIAGDQDVLVGFEESRQTAEALPQGRLVSIPGAGHLQPLEAPAAVADALHGLLDRIGDTPC
ncbi:alpha/beta fold hydrolase [Kitasatospora sp. NPDC057223]|uniref:alpha/beta fold hydrolase n=1 Tax=Kitasatospora sp. NPDC057223 TaxID=3346055 RepID=UPI00363A13C6